MSNSGLSAFAGAAVLPNLQQLRLNNNQLAVAPNLPPQWVSLELAGLSNNQITVAPSLPPQLVAIRQLWVDNNQLSAAAINTVLGMVANTAFSATGKQLQLQSNPGSATHNTALRTTAAAAPYNWNITI